jgi:hypothetical protein
MRSRFRGGALPGVHVGGVFPWLVPYLVIWGGTVGLVRVLDLRASCTGFCAVYAGFQTYTLLLIAAVLSVIVASTELYLGRPH